MQPTDTDRASDECVHFASAHEASAVRRHHHGDSFGLYAIDANTIDSKEALLTAIAAAMHFPDYFGMNWDALVDCLRDMSWDVHDGYVLIVRNAEILFAESPAVAETFVSCWRDAARSWAPRVPFHLMIVG